MFKGFGDVFGLIVVVIVFVLFVGLALFIVLHYLRRKQEKALERLDEFGLKEERRLKEMKKKKKAGKKHSEDEMKEAVAMITEARREGESVEEATKMLLEAGFSEKEIGEILEKSDREM